MNQRQRFRPFTGDSDKRVLLQNAPLSLVLCQVRWPELAHLQLDWKNRALSFGAELKNYPIFQESQEVAYTVTPEGVQQETAGHVYQWRSVDGSWNVSLGRRFLSLYCTEYSNFTDFSDRLKETLELLKHHLEVPVVERIGYRYVNQLTEQKLLDDLGSYVHEAVLGYSSIKPATTGVQVVSSANQALYSIEDVMLQVRSGIIPPGQTVDPAIAPANTESWVLDLDSFRSENQIFDVSEIMESVAKLSDAAYDFFKLVVTDGFIKEFGGNCD